MGNAKTPHKPSIHVRFHGVTLGDLIEASYHKFYFGETSNGPHNNDIIDKDHHTDNDGNIPMILTNLSKREKFSPAYIGKVIYNSKPSSTKSIKELIIERNIYFQVNTTFIYVSTQNITNCQSLADRGANGRVAGEDVTVINIYSHRHVNIRGIDNHEITSVNIDTIDDLSQ